MGICEELNYSSQKLLRDFYDWAREHNIEPNHAIVILDSGMFLTQTHTVWTSFDHILLMMNRAAQIIKMEQEGKTDQITLGAEKPEVT